MAQFKSTSIVGNLAVTGSIVASEIIKNDGTADQLLRADGGVQSLSDLTDAIGSNTEAIGNLKGTGAAGSTGDVSTLTVVNALSRANEAWNLANGKIGSSELNDYATKDYVDGVKEELIGDEETDETIKYAINLAGEAKTAAGNITNGATNTTLKGIEDVLANKLEGTTVENKILIGGTDTKSVASSGITIQSSGDLANSNTQMATTNVVSTAIGAVLGTNTDASSANTVHGVKNALSEHIESINNQISSAGDAEKDSIVSRAEDGQINSEKFAITNGTSVVATYQYNSSTDCIELVWA